MTVAFCFAQYGPYHHARVAAFSEPGIRVIPIQVAAVSHTYAWEDTTRAVEGLRSLVPGAEEDASFLKVFFAALKIWRHEGIDVAFLPSYAPASSFALLLSAKIAGVRCVMMNESHAGTEKAKGIKRLIKKLLVSWFHGALVGGEPHRRYFVRLGMSPDRIVTGYDAIDNRYFTEAARAARGQDAELRLALNLPSRYLLSLGRMVIKKNLTALVDAFAMVKCRRPGTDLKLVFVGSGECQSDIVATCESLGLSHSVTPAEDGGKADVLFYGFRQIEENPIFYALSEGFVLPSLYEEWGLVVNEAMACGLPILVSQTVGSAEDLVEPGLNGYHFDPESVSDLADKILLLENDPQARRRMGDASLERIQNWGCENFAAQARKIISIVTQ